MSQNIGKNFGFFGLFKFALPSIVMMMFSSLYVIADGIFISRFVSTDALSALNIVYPTISILFAISILVGTGGNAIVSKQMGEGNYEKANKTFSLLVLFCLTTIAIYISIIAIFPNQILNFLGAEENLMDLCREYMILLAFAPCIACQGMFQLFFATAGKPILGLISIMSAGITNIVLDYVFIVPLQMGLFGAALATGIGYCIPTIIGMVFFTINKKGLHFTFPNVSGENAKIILKTIVNGSSEMVISISASIITIIYNVLLMRLVGSDGVAAMTIVFYAQFLFSSFYLGYTIGVSPIVGYNYGAKNIKNLNKYFKESLIFIGICGIVISISSFFLAESITKIFAEGNEKVLELGTEAMKLFAITYMFSGINIVSSGLFTAVSDGLTSALISFLRTGFFSISFVYLFEFLFELKGMWLAIPCAEIVTLICVIVIYIVKIKTHTLYPKISKENYLKTKKCIASEK